MDSLYVAESVSNLICAIADDVKERFKTIKVRWTLEEAIVLFDVYFQNGFDPKVSDEKLMEVSRLYRNRAQKLDLLVDSKFRNLPGLRMQLGCIHYVVTDGKEGLPNASQAFYQTWSLHKTEPKRFDQILKQFYQDYDVRMH